VDHIVPRYQGGSDDLSNLQSLCFRCNAAKRDTDTTDFRGLQASYASREAGCVFCAPEVSGRVLLENELALCIADAYPVKATASQVHLHLHGIGYLPQKINIKRYVIFFFIYVPPVLKGGSYGLKLFPKFGT
jgi:hypothetical protein